MGWFDFLRRRPEPNPVPVRNSPWPPLLPHLAWAAIEPAADSVAIAVVACGYATQEEYADVGQRLRRWRRATPAAREVIGLEQLLLGQPPETPCWLLGVPFSPDQFTDPVALVHIAPGADTDDAARALQALFEGCAVVRLYSPDFYSYINR